MDKVTETYVRQFTDPARRLGATYEPGKGTHIRVWAPKAKDVTIEWEGKAPAPLKKDGDYFTGLFPDAHPGDRYRFRLDGGAQLADPASRYQPEDTLGASAVVAQDFNWTDQAWRGVPYSKWVIYELHTGTYSPTHDFDGIRADLPRLKKLGVNAIEIMPVSQFSGARNWGYDGVFPHAVQDSYGGPEKLKALVDACHAHGIAVILDVVYNHLGPEGNVLPQFGPYTQDKYHTPWGEAINFDGRGSDDVRRYFLQSAWQWLTEFHIDGLRLDAVHAIFDTSPVPFLEDLSRMKDAAEKLRGQKLALIAETDANDSRLLKPVDKNGLGMDTHWADDLHHALHATLTGEHDGYYADYGGLKQLARIYERGVAFEDDYSPFRRRRHGRSYDGIDPKRLVVESQNHDQIGNRLRGDRLIAQAGFEKAKLAAAAILLSPFTPLLFMGEELATDKPFTYFVSHHGHDLIEAVRKGRAAEWKDFAWQETPPDPAGQDTFDSCVLDTKAKRGSEQAAMQAYYKQLIALSKRFRAAGKPSVALDEAAKRITLTYKTRGKTMTAVLSFNEAASAYDPGRPYICLLRSEDWKKGATAPKSFNGTGPLTMAPFSAAVLEF
jgi:maltooligosyltrehalose trehalohydrolase